MIDRPKTEQTPSTKLMQRMSPIIEDIIAGRNAVAVCRDHGIRSEVHAFIRRSLGLRKRAPKQVNEDLFREVFNYTFEHSICETAAHFGISKSTVSSYIRRACGVQR